MCAHSTHIFESVFELEPQHGVRSGELEVLDTFAVSFSETWSVKRLCFTFIGIKMAELAGLPIPSMDWHSPDALQAFKKFKARCELYFSGPLKEKLEEEQVSYLLIWSGDDGIELVFMWALTATEKKKLDTYWTRFENYQVTKSKKFHLIVLLMLML